MSDSKPLLAQEQALTAYLQDMLMETETIETEADISVLVEPKTEKSNATVQDAHLVSEITPNPLATSANDKPLQVLLLQLHGLSLAISVQDLSGILKWPEQPMSKMPGKPDWYLGLISNPQQYTQVVDIAHILLPEKVPDPLEAKYIIMIDDNRWGLACEKVSKVVTLKPGEVKWRQQTGNRKWLAGTLLDEMYSIIDVNELAGLLNTK